LSLTEDLAKVGNVVHLALKLTGGKNHNLWISGTSLYLGLIAGKYQSDILKFC